MLATLVIILIILWLLGYLHVGSVYIPDITLFTINNQIVTLWDLLILLVVAWAVGILPTPFREIAGVLLILWVLSVLGILAISGIALSNILVIAIIVGLIVSLFTAAM